MKNTIKALVCILIGLSFVGCKNSVRPSIIESYKKENIGLENKVSNMQTIKSNLTFEIDKRYSTLLTSIDPKKKNDFDRDKKLKKSLFAIKQEFEKISKDYEYNYVALKDNIESNFTFIESIPDMKDDAGLIDINWKENIQICNELVEVNKGLEVALNKLSAKYKDSMEQGVKKYGVKEVTNKK